MKKTPKILNIKSDKTELRKVEFFLSDIFDEYELPRGGYNKVFLCVSEAVMNSIDHGNRNDSRKQVSIEVKCFDNNVDIKICDEGRGFDYTNLDDPTEFQNLKRETGRGIHIIKSLSRELEFKNEGNTVRFKLNVCE